jgi:hypothetical protein
MDKITKNRLTNDFFCATVISKHTQTNKTVTIHQLRFDLSYRMTSICGEVFRQKSQKSI